MGALALRLGARVGGNVVKQLDSLGLHEQFLGMPVVKLVPFLLLNLLACPAFAQNVQETSQNSPGAAGAAQTSAEVRAELEEGEEKPQIRPSANFPLSGDVRVDNTVGVGTFTPGESRRSSFDLGLFLRAGLSLGHGMNLGAIQTVTKNIVSNVDSGASRPYDTIVGDTLLTFAWSPTVLDATGEHQPWLLPGGIKFGLSLTAALPTSRASRFQTRYVGLTPSLSLVKPDLFAGKLSLVYAFGFTKNFNRLTTTSVDAVNFPTLARPEGPELVSGQTEIATGTLNTSFALRNTVAISFLPTARLAIGLTWVLYNNFKYNDFPQDAYTSLNAKSGYGRSDLQWGIVTVGYTFDPAEKWTLSAMAFTASPPFSADNRTYRFPFLDLRSTADNYTSIGLSVNRTF